MTYDEYMELDYQDVTNAICVSNMPKEVIDSIWVEKSPNTISVID